MRGRVGLLSAAGVLRAAPGDKILRQLDMYQFR